MAKKSVVVQLNNFNRVISFSPETGGSERLLLLEAIREGFKERVGEGDRLTLQVKSEEWDGMYIDFFGETIEDRMKLRLVVEKPEVSLLDSI